MKNIFSKITLLSRLIRLPNLIILALCMYFVRYFIFLPIYASRAMELHLGDTGFALLVLSVLLVAAGGYVLNDIFDVRADQANRPEKAVLPEHVSIKTANALYYTLSIAGCMLGIYVAFHIGALKLGFIHLMSVAVLYYYSLKYKRIAFAGNITVALMSALVIIIVWLFEFFAIKNDALAFAEMVGYFRTLNILVLIYAFFAFLSNLIREMVKDIEDIEGDRVAGCRTIPIRYGETTARRIIVAASVVMLAFLGFVAWKYFAWDYHPAAWFMSIVLGSMWIYCITALLRAKEKADYHNLSTSLKIFIIAGILSMQLLYFNF